ncbi:MAG: helix-turn-helix domain-containing protein [Pirellulaceae bacterium]
MAMTTTPEFLTVQETGQLLRCSTAKILKLIHTKRLEAANVATGDRPRWRIPVASIRRFTSTKD